MTQGSSIPGFPSTTPMSEKKSLLTKLSNFSFFFTLLIIVGGAVEIYFGNGYVGGCGYFGNQNCHRRINIGAPIWCSIVPVFAALMGNCSGREKTIRPGGAYTCPTVGAVSMGLLALIECAFLNKLQDFFQAIQIALIVVALLNMTLFIIASGLQCCMGGCCQVHDDFNPVAESGAVPLVNGTEASVLTNQA